MNPTIHYDNYLSMPDLIQNYLVSAEIAAFNRAQIETFGLNDDQIDALIMLESGVAGRTIALADVPGAIAARIGLTAEESRRLAEKIWIFFCGSIRWYFPDLGEVMAAAGFALPEKNPYPVEQPVTTVAAALIEIQKTAADIPERIKPAVEAYVRDLLQMQIFDMVAITAKLQSTLLDQGFGLSAGRAQAIMKRLCNFIGVYRFSDLGPRIDPTTLATDVLAPQEAVELSVAKSAAAPIADSNVTQQQQSMIEAVLAIEPLSDRSADVQQKWRSIVAARVGGARDASQTRALLGEHAETGGLDLTPPEVEKMSTLLEQTMNGFEKKREEFSVMEKIASVQQATAGIIAGPEAQARESQKEINQRFVSMFGKDAVEEIRRETRREIESPEAAHPGEAARSHVAPVTFNAPTPEQVTPSTQSVAPTQQIQPQQEPKYVPKIPDKLKQLIDADVPILPMKQKTSEEAAKQKKSSDIRSGPRLVGPVDELRGMTLVDFRRLSPDVSVRIQKIRSKIEVIGQDGPHEKIRAVQAVEQSEPVKLYRDLLKQSLVSGRSVEELSAENKSLGKPSLETDELVAIKQFLSQIRFSSI